MLRPLRVFSHYVAGRSLALFAGDIVILTASIYMGDWIGMFGLPSVWLGYPPILPKVTVYVLIGVLTFYVAGLYDAGPKQGRKELAVRVMVAAAVWAILFAAFAFSTPALRLSRLASFLGFGTGTLGVIGIRWLSSLQTTATGHRERLLFLGATPVADRLISELEAGNPGYEILGYVDDRPPAEIALTNGFRVLGKCSQLQEIVASHQARTIVVALAERRGSFPMQAILDCKLRGVRIEDWPTFYEKLTGKIVVQNLRPSWLVFSEGFTRSRIMPIGKRLVDLALSCVFLALGWPIFLLAALAITLDFRGPIFFRQERVGERGRIFTLLKFRTMVEHAEALTGPVWTTDEDPRITRVGRWLRKTRLDEFPQILNVLKGEMSFIGPRPERPHFVAELQEKIPYYTQRHTIKPGITGWAQVRYHYGASIEDAEEKLQYDLYYVKNMSPFLDMLILLSSIQVVLFGKGAR
jgi:sugar transferase (PEP-CTERM system associated)